jgi:heme/copper-type cytochrome/quinol oxidase subunit 3
MEGEELIKAHKTARKNLLWVGIASIVMMFAGLTSAYVVLQKDHYWVMTDLPSMFLYSTIIILISSVTMWWALRSLKASNFGSFKKGIIVTLILGIAFSFTQYLGWQELIVDGKVFVGHIGDIKGYAGRTTPSFFERHAVCAQRHSVQQTFK